MNQPIGRPESSEGNRPSIRMSGVSVFYHIQHNRPSSLKEYFVRLTQGGIRSESVRALDDVSMEISPGEVFGIVGVNGAGKSTLLKVISGIIRPTRGRVQVWEPTVPLLGVGAGFHPELTGRENIYLYSAILGRSQEQTEDTFDEIVEFSELQEFIDAPLRVYSSGMVARLGFAVAMAKRPEILLIDEVLAIGDERFQQKCQERFQEFQEADTTIVIVTHSMRIVETTCDRAIWLSEGRNASIGPSEDVIHAYREALRQSS